MRTITTLSAAALLAVGLTAQTTVNTIPSGFGTTKGGSSIHWMMRYGSSRGICKYSPKATGWTTAKVINELALRNDEYWYSTTALKIQVSVSLGTKGVAVSDRSSKWSAHMGSVQAAWMPKTAFNRAAFSKNTTGTNPFDLVLKGPRPFVSLDGSLAVDLKTYCGTAHYNPYHYVDGQYSSTTSTGTRGTYYTYGTPCNPTSFYNYATGYNEQDTFQTYCYTRNVGDVVLAWLGGPRANISFGGGCTIYSVPVIMHPVPQKTTSTSAVYFSWGKVPAGMKGKKVTAQNVAITPKAALRFSRGTEITFGDYVTTYPTMSIYSYTSSRTASVDPDKVAPMYYSGTVPVFRVK